MHSHFLIITALAASAVADMPRLEEEPYHIPLSVHVGPGYGRNESLKDIIPKFAQSGVTDLYLADVSINSPDSFSFSDPFFTWASISPEDRADIRKASPEVKIFANVIAPISMRNTKGLGATLCGAISSYDVDGLVLDFPTLENLPADLPKEWAPVIIDCKTAFPKFDFRISAPIEWYQPYWSADHVSRISDVIKFMAMDLEPSTFVIQHLTDRFQPRNAYYIDYTEDTNPGSVKVLMESYSHKLENPNAFHMQYPLLPDEARHPESFVPMQQVHSDTCRAHEELGWAGSVVLQHRWGDQKNTYDTYQYLTSPCE